MKEATPIYSAKDLSRYHAGEMTAAEMHALERAALADPFLADALEGFSVVEDANEDIAALRSELAGRTGRRKLFLMSNSRNAQWLRIAAIFVIFAGIGYTFYRFNFSEPANQLAQKPAAEKSLPAIAETPPPAAATNTTIDTTSTAAVVFPRKKETTVASSITATASSSVAGAMTKPANAPMPAKLRAEQADQFVKVLPAPVTGNVTTTKGEPLEGALVTIGGTTSVVTDQNGRFEMPATSNNAQASEVAVQRDYSNAQQNNSVSNNSVSNNSVSNNSVSNNSLANNDVTNNSPAYSLPRRSKDYYKNADVSAKKEDREDNTELLRKALQDKNDAQANGVAKMEPIDSVVFVDYAEKNRKEIKSPKGKIVSGSVTLSFTVNKKSRPENIKVEKSLCAACDEEAIRLLKTGPSWLFAGTKRKQVVVELAESPTEDE